MHQDRQMDSDENESNTQTHLPVGRVESHGSDFDKYVLGAKLRDGMIRDNLHAAIAGRDEGTLR